MLTTTVRGDDRDIQITGHALSRWRDRVYPEDTIEQAAGRLLDKIKDSGVIKQKRPRWAYRTGDMKHKLLTVGYVVVNQPRELGKPRLEVAFPLTIRGDGLVATTALVQGWDREAH